MSISTTHRRVSVVAASTMLLLGAATLSASARPNPGEALATTVENSSNRCPLERVGTQYVRCGNLTGNGVPAPTWVPDSSRESDIETTASESTSLAPPRMRLALFPEDPGFARMVKVVVTLTDMETYAPITGTVRFEVDGLGITEVPLDRAGKATRLVSVWGLSSLSVSAGYSGDETHDGGVGTLQMNLVPLA